MSWMGRRVVMGHLVQQDNKVNVALVMMIFLWSIFGMLFFFHFIEMTIERKQWVVVLISGPIIWDLYSFLMFEEWLKK